MSERDGRRHHGRHTAHQRAADLGVRSAARAGYDLDVGKTRPERCHICGDSRPLTTERMISQGAGNTRRLMVHSLYSISRGWSRGEIFRSGLTRSTLCPSCNSFCGKRYVRPFAEWTLQAACYHSRPAVCRPSGRQRQVRAAVGGLARWPPVPAASSSPIPTGTISRPSWLTLGTRPRSRGTPWRTPSSFHLPSGRIRQRTCRSTWRSPRP